MLSEEKLVFSLRLMEGEQGGPAGSGAGREASGGLTPDCVPFRGLGL